MNGYFVCGGGANSDNSHHAIVEGYDVQHLGGNSNFFQDGPYSTSENGVIGFL